MIFGIDLGTTNSLIGTGDELLSNLVSSNVDMKKKKQVARDYVSEDVVSSYKTDMSMGDSGKLSIEASAVILKELANQGTRRYGEEVKEVVISVPAYFSTSQREAVYKAAEIAGLEVKGLLNEPTAASIYICKDMKDLVVVYDLGGGTFDVTIVDSRLGNYSVIATDGIILGGDNLDRAIVEDAIKDCKIPIRFRTKTALSEMKSKMRLAKEQIQRTRSTVFVDLSEYGAKCEYQLTEDKYKQIVKDVFGRTIQMTSYLICKNIPSDEDPKIIFVGGSSACPYLRELLKEELLLEDGLRLEEITSDVNPDLVVAKGVALYAKMMYDGVARDCVEDVTKRLCIEDSNGKSITIIDSNSIIPCRNTVTVNNSEKSDRLCLRLYQGDSLVAKKNDYIGTLEFDYGHEVAPDEGLVEVTVEVSNDGIISLTAEDVLSFGLAQSVKLTAR